MSDLFLKGVGKDCLSPGDYVQRMRIVDSTGELRTYSKDEDEAQFKAVSANFGLFGIIYDMTIKVQDQICVSTENRYLRLGDYVYNQSNLLKSLVNSNWSIEILWFPFGSLGCSSNYNPKDDKLYVRVINKINPEDHTLADKSFYICQDMKDKWSAAMQKISNNWMISLPSLTPSIGKAGFLAIKNVLYPKDTIYQELPQAIHFR